MDDPWIRYSITPHKASLKSEHERRVLIQTASVIGCVHIVIPCAAFDASDWKKYYGLKVTDAPILPKKLSFDPTKELLILVPKGLSLSKYWDMIQAPLEGSAFPSHKGFDDTMKDHFGSQEVANSYWLVISKTNGEKGDTQPVIDTSSSEADSTERLPSLLETVIAFGTAFTRSDEILFSDGEKSTQVLCSEQIPGFESHCAVTFSPSDQALALLKATDTNQPAAAARKIS